jgi:hypothetical protein
MEFIPARISAVFGSGGDKPHKRSNKNIDITNKVIYK